MFFILKFYLAQLTICISMMHATCQNTWAESRKYTAKPFRKLTGIHENRFNVKWLVG